MTICDRCEKTSQMLSEVELKLTAKHPLTSHPDWARKYKTLKLELCEECMSGLVNYLIEVDMEKVLRRLPENIAPEED